MIHLNVDRRYKPLNLEPLLKKSAQKTLAHEGAAQEAELTIAVSGDLKVQKLNRQFRGESRATDVLSFPAEESDAISGGHYLGDVVISLPRARAQAKKGKHSLEAELQLLVVHGVLHLLGHDHAELQDKDRMWVAQADILVELGLSIGTAHAETPHP